VERKIDELRFSQWKTGRVRSLELHLEFNKYVESQHSAPEHFRVCLELQSVFQEKRSIFLGARDDFWPDGDTRWFFGTKTFFWRQSTGASNLRWIPNPVRAGGGIITGIDLSVGWRPISDVMVAEFENLGGHLHFTANLASRISRVRFYIDDYVVIDGPIDVSGLTNSRPSIDWPGGLSPEEEALEWRFHRFWLTTLDCLPPRKTDS
jgi:hypothetical protein